MFCFNYSSVFTAWNLVSRRGRRGAEVAEGSVFQMLLCYRCASTFTAWNMFCFSQRSQGCRGRRGFWL